MAARTVEDRLREEYFDLAGEIRRVAEQLEAELRFHLLPLSRRLRHGEQVVVKTRSKDCDSAIAKLRRQQEGSVFDPEKSVVHSLTVLKDLAAARVLTFPRSYMREIDELFRGVFPEWKSDPFKDWPDLGYKYFGYCAASDKVQGEYQIVPMLVGLFWQVEHAAMYKPPERIVHSVREPLMRDRQRAVLKALTDFEDEWSLRTIDGAAGSE